MALLVAMLSCKHDLDADYTKRNLVERTVVVSAFGANVKIRAKLPEGLEPSARSPSWFEPAQAHAAPSVHFDLRDAASAPKTAQEAFVVYGRAGAYASHDLDDGFVLTNTDSNYYTNAIRRFSAAQTPSGVPLVVACEVEYRDASALGREKELVQWMERICTDATIVR